MTTRTATANADIDAVFHRRLRRGAIRQFEISGFAGDLSFHAYGRLSTQAAMICFR